MRNRIIDPEPYYRVNAALLRENEPKMEMYKSCKRCYGSGTDNGKDPCLDCDGLGSVMQTPKSCKGCCGTGKVPIDKWHGAHSPYRETGYGDCTECGGLGTVMQP